jgi:SAM-dependent methyltransferase/pimeloyl-ACP methyl ester carboxylesterase
MISVTFNNSRDLRLSGNLYPASLEDIVILCHGFTSDKYSSGRFERLTKALNLIGLSALTFDFSGCGESDDDTLNMKKEADDLKSAINYVKSQGYKRIALYGHSLGTVICMKVYSEEIIAMVLSGAGTDSMKYNWSEFFSEEQMKELEKKGIMTELRPGEIREKIVIEEQMLREFESVDGKKLLTGIKCPVLIMHGNKGKEENFLLEKSKRGIKYLSPESRLVVIDGENHSFMGDYEKLVSLTCDWFEKWFDRDKFNKMAKTYSDNISDRTKYAAKDLIKRLELNENTSVLDVGCGTGVLYPIIKEKNAEYTGIDISKNMVKELFNIFPEADVLNLDFEERTLYENSFDFIIIYNSIPHFNNLDGIFQNAFDNLKSGGRFIIAHSKTRLQLKDHHKKINYKSSKEPIPSDEKLMELSKKYGFINVKIEDDKYFYFSCEKRNSYE